MDYLKKWWFVLIFLASLVFNAGGFYTITKVRNNDMYHMELKQEKILDLVIKLSNSISRIEGRMNGKK